MNEDFVEPKYCPFACGETLIVKKVTQQIFLDTLPDDVILDTVRGFICQKCGYATTVYETKKKRAW